MKIFKDGKTVILYPSWYDDVRKRKAEGQTNQKLMEEFGCGLSTIGAIVSDNWRAYLLRWEDGAKPQSLTTYHSRVKDYVFHPRPEEPPSKREISKKERLAKARAYAKRYAQETVREHEEAMSKVREFTTVSKLHEGKSLKGAKIKCSKCGAAQEYYNYSGSVTPAYLAKEFMRRGWFVGKNENTDLCPSCYAALKGRKPPQPMAEEIIASKPNGRHEETAVTFNFKPNGNGSHVMAAEEVERKHDEATAAPQTDLPKVPDRAMDKTDRRLIFARLNEVYGEEMYLEDWTDDKVAEDLGVPVDWVASVREQDFGPDVNAETKAKEVGERERELKELSEKIERQIVLINKKLQQMEALDEKVTVIHDQIAEQIERFEEIERSLETEDKHMKELLTAFDNDVKAFNKKAESLSSNPS